MLEDTQHQRHNSVSPPPDQPLTVLSVVRARRDRDIRVHGMDRAPDRRDQLLQIPKATPRFLGIHFHESGDFTQ